MNDHEYRPYDAVGNKYGELKALQNSYLYDKITGSRTITINTFEGESPEKLMLRFIRAVMDEYEELKAEQEQSK